MQDLNDKLQRLLNAKKTQIEMVADRGFEVNSVNFPRESDYLDFELKQFTDRLSRLAAANNQPLTISLLNAAYYRADGRSLLVFYAGRGPQSKQIPKEPVKYFIEQIKEKGFTDAVLIADAKLSTQADKALNTELNDQNLQIFQLSELTYNVTRHVDTPRHTLLTPQEKFEKMKELRVDETKLPLIHLTDPVVKYYGWPLGGLVKIERRDLNVGALVSRSINYRIIIHNKT